MHDKSDIYIVCISNNGANGLGQNDANKLKL